MTDGKGQLQTIEMYMVIVGISLLVGIMLSLYSSSASSLSRAAEKRIRQVSLSDFCLSMAEERIPGIDKKLGELLSIYNLTGNGIFVFEDRYVVNLTAKLESTMSSAFGDRWNFTFGALSLGHPHPAAAAGCRIYVPSIGDRGYTYAVLRTW